MTLFDEDVDQNKKQMAANVRGVDPLFDVKLVLNDTADILPHEIKEIECDDFLIPPHG